MLDKSNFCRVVRSDPAYPYYVSNPVAKQKFRVTKWPTYSKALINRDFMSVWLDDEAIQPCESPSIMQKL
ncbi:hypothetical protein OA44_18335 [Enterobacter cloacae]|nr:hypothetical protein OA44_18335 [Enterobacter cloacae]